MNNCRNFKLRNLCNHEHPAYKEYWPVNAHNIGLMKETADSGEICYGIVILGLVLELVLAQERLDNRPQNLIHVGLADQIFLYNHQICRPQCLTSPGDMANMMHETPCSIQILKFCENGVTTS